MAPLTWFITGCSSGFGEQFAYSILARGDKVIATARKPDSIAHFKEAGAAVLQLDITDDQRNMDAVMEKALQVYGKIDVLVNNAAYISIGTWEELGYEDFLAQFDTNVFGTIKVTRALLPHFRQRHAGTVVFIGSLSGWIGHPGCSAYAGSKFALEGMVESLQQEVSPFGIRTLLMEPGRFRTKLLSSQNMKTVQPTIADYSEFSKARITGLEEGDRKQPGDPVKFVEYVLDLVRGEGIAEGKEIPFRLPLGKDVFDDVKRKCEETLKMLEDWKNVIRGTDLVE
ncbi:NAD(P)-binding protein [Cadophora sp. DSE1049]|nr:NAD(P)-binding protein [Cadophora sp. DSE1049]